MLYAHFGGSHPVVDLRLPTSDFITTETPKQVLSWQFCKILQKHLFKEQIRVAASDSLGHFCIFLSSTRECKFPYTENLKMGNLIFKPYKMITRVKKKLVSIH